MHTDRSKPSISIIVPVHNNPGDLHQCLTRLGEIASETTEIIVVDDASTDETPAVAAEFGAHVERLDKNGGPAVARNLGANIARGEILLFVDADVVLAPDAISRLEEGFGREPEIAAIFGSYDDEPFGRGLVSRYRNLLHHFVHQHGSPEASTFWAGCGAVRREAFLAVGGFDARRYPRPCIEDIELGYRLRAAGFRIRLDPQVQGKHLKRWSFRSVVRTDITCRAIPWTRLLLEDPSLPGDLNLKIDQKICGAATVLAFTALVCAAFYPPLLAVSLGLLLGVMLVNRELLIFFARHGGPVFATGCLLMHLLYYLYSVLSFAYVWLDVRLARRVRLAWHSFASG